MGLAIDGNVVHGIARGGQAFVGVGDATANGSINIGGQYYLSTNKIHITETDGVNLGFTSYLSSVTPDVTSQLSDYGGQWAILKLSDPSFSPDDQSQPFLIPTTPTTENLSMDNKIWTVSLSRDTNNRFTLTVSIDSGHYATSQEEGIFYIISN